MAGQESCKVAKVRITENRSTQGRMKDRRERSHSQEWWSRFQSRDSISRAWGEENAC